MCSFVPATLISGLGLFGIEMAARKRLTIRPRYGNGWVTTLDRAARMVRMQFTLFRIKTPLKRAIPFSDIALAGTVSRPSWWSWIVTPISRSIGRGIVLRRSRPGRTQMPRWGWRHDITLTLKQGNTIKVATVKSPDRAREIQRHLSEKTGLGKSR